MLTSCLSIPVRINSEVTTGIPAFIAVLQTESSSGQDIITVLFPPFLGMVVKY